MRLIDADEYADCVIDHMTTPWDRAKKHISNDYDKGLYDATLLLRTTPTIHPEPHWIPCSERLPEYNETVLTWDGHTFCIEKRIPYIRDDDGEPIEGDWWVGDEYDEYESDYYPNLRDGAAIAWMPLPEPYAKRRTDETD